MSRLIQIITGNTGLQSEGRVGHRSHRRSVACLPGVESMEQRISLSTMVVSGPIVTNGVMPPKTISRPGQR